jgi:hypothetical protein
MIARFGCSGIYTTGYACNIDTFPAAFRVRAMGITNLVANSLAVLGPLIAEMQEPIPLSFFVISSSLGILVAQLLVTKEEQFKTD